MKKYGFSDLLCFCVAVLCVLYAELFFRKIYYYPQTEFFMMLYQYFTYQIVPPFEECMFRGLIFRNLYGKSPLIAYLVSIAAFAAIHILGYLGMYTPLEIAMACLQYLPAGLCLAWAYTRADTIFAPIVIHAVINYLSLRALR